MNFLRKPWVLGGLVGLMFSLLFIMLLGPSPTLRETASTSLIFFLIFVPVGALAGLLFSFPNIVAQSVSIGIFIGLVLELLFVFLVESFPDPGGAIIIALILFSIFVGIGAFGGAAIGLVIFAVSKGKSGYDKNILR